MFVRCFGPGTILEGHANSQLELFYTKDQNMGQNLANFQEVDCCNENQNCQAIRRWLGVWPPEETSQSRVQRYRGVVQSAHWVFSDPVRGRKRKIYLEE